MKNDKSIYDPIAKQLKIIIRNWCAATGQTREEAVEIFIPTILRSIEQFLRDSLK